MRAVGCDDSRGRGAGYRVGDDQEGKGSKGFKVAGIWSEPSTEERKTGDLVRGYRDFRN